MTICIAVKVNDCLVFVTDSASSILNTDGNGNKAIMRVYDNGHKLFNLIRGKPVAAMTCGLGNFGSRSISTIAKEIRHELESGSAGIDPNAYTMEEIANFCFDHFKNLYQHLDQTLAAEASFSFFLGGISSGQSGSELWKCGFDGGAEIAPICISGEDDCGIAWDGQPEACVRLVTGISSQTRSILEGAGVAPEDAAGVTHMLAQASEVMLLEPSMPIQDAIDLAKFLAETTVSFVRFLPGANTVGGDLDIAAVTKFEGFRWIKRKHFYPVELNRETDHDR